MINQILDLLYIAIIFCGVFMFSFVMLMVVNSDFRKAFFEDVRKKK